MKKILLGLVSGILLSVVIIFLVLAIPNIKSKYFPASTKKVESATMNAKTDTKIDQNTNNNSASAEQDKQTFIDNFKTQLQGLTYSVNQQIKIYKYRVLVKGLAPVKQVDIDETNSNLNDINNRISTLRTLQIPNDPMLKQEYNDIMLKADNLYNVLREGQDPLVQNYSNQLESIFNNEIKPAQENFNNSVSSIVTDDGTIENGNGNTDSSAIENSNSNNVADNQSDAVIKKPIFGHWASHGLDMYISNGSITTQEEGNGNITHGNYTVINSIDNKIKIKITGLNGLGNTYLNVTITPSNDKQTLEWDSQQYDSQGNTLGDSFKSTYQYVDDKTQP